jgi:hypothetical protein
LTGLLATEFRQQKLLYEAYDTVYLWFRELVPVSMQRAVSDLWHCIEYRPLCSSDKPIRFKGVHHFLHSLSINRKSIGSGETLKSVFESGTGEYGSDILVPLLTTA